MDAAVTTRRGTEDAIPPDAFLSAYPDEIRALAEKLRAVVRRAAPDAIERVRFGWRLIGYDLPVGRRTVYFAWVAPSRSTSISAGSTAPSWPIRTGCSKARTFD